MGAVDRAIGNLARNPGFGDSLMADARGRLLSANKHGTANAINRRAGEGSAKGLFDSGLTQQGIQGLEADFHGKYLDSLQNLEMQNAQQALQGLGLSSSHFLGKRGLANQMSIANMQDATQNKIASGQLGLGHSQLDMQRAWQEFQMNLLAQGYSPSGPGGGGAGAGAYGPLAADIAARGGRGGGYA